MFFLQAGDEAVQRICHGHVDLHQGGVDANPVRPHIHRFRIFVRSLDARRGGDSRIVRRSCWRRRKQTNQSNTGRKKAETADPN
jgi:hypothetical protein